ncbi:TIGR04255 family protein [Aulosira sp. FACHB-615]|uniref:TIGR04255 family protein n=1 Tax=Aulosira sp. FACHB-615 TaxID=2692777 RepID=UPI001689FE60|nr:TIGR04255 family protein [Aulosira sp. FACHB-615]MBD2492432.1 TIGR04255 family protein [Aulosira sp. FACHB-615]
MSIAKFSKSPLTEVVLGVEFNDPGFSSVHFGLYWQSIQDRFPSPPLDRPPIGDIELLPMMPKLRRVWFESLDRKQLIQLQSNRFHYNWRRQGEADEYPHFKEIYPRFESEWQHFQEWWIKTENTVLQPIRYEITYLNQIDQSFGWYDPRDNHKIFTFIGKDWEGYLEKPIFCNANFEFDISEQIGILAVKINQTIRVDDNNYVILLELTTRSIDTKLNFDDWFNSAHEYTVDAFLHLITEEVKQKWGLKWLAQ